MTPMIRAYKGDFCMNIRYYFYFRARLNLCLYLWIFADHFLVKMDSLTIIFLFYFFQGPSCIIILMEKDGVSLLIVMKRVTLSRYHSHASLLLLHLLTHQLLHQLLIHHHLHLQNTHHSLRIAHSLIHQER